MHAVKNANKLQIKSPIELALRGMLGHPYYLTFCVILGIGLGGALAYFLASNRYRYTGKMVYVPNRVTEPFYVSPDLRNLTNVVYNPVMLEELRQKWDIVDEPDVFIQRLQFQVSGSHSIDATYVAKDAEQARAVLQDAMESFVAHARQLRSDAIGRHIKDFEREIAEAQGERDGVLSQLEQSLRPKGLQSSTELDAKITDLRQSIIEQQGRIAATYDRQQLSQAQVKSLIAMRNATDSPNADESEMGQTPDGTDTASNDDNESMADQTAPENSDAADAKARDREDREIALASFENNREAMQAKLDLERQRLLEAEIRRRQEVEVYNAKVAAKLIDLERDLSLYRRNLISKADYEKTKSELDILRAQRPDAVIAMENDLDEIQGRIKNRVSGMPLMSMQSMIPGLPVGIMSESQEKQTIALLRGSELASQSHLKVLNEALGVRAEELEELTSLQTEIAPVVNRLDGAERTLDRLRVRQEIFEQTGRSDTDELIIVQESIPMINGVVSNDTKFFAVGFAATILGLLGPLFLVKFKNAADRKPQGQNVFGIPVLGQSPSPRAFRKRPEESGIEMKRLAMRICQKLGPDQTVVAIADERSAAPNVDRNQDLADHLVEQLRRAGKTATTCPSEQLFGNAKASPDGGEDDQSDHGNPMTIDFQSLRDQNDYVVLSTDLIGNPFELEFTATRSDAVVLVARSKTSQSPEMQKTIADLAELGTPMLGVIIRQ